MKRHELDLTSVISGLIFAAVGVVFLIDLSPDYAARPRWIVALVLIGLGVAGLSSTRKPRLAAERSAAAEATPAEATPAAATPSATDEL